MTDIIPLAPNRMPLLVEAAGEKASLRFLEFFAGQIRNANTRRAYSRAVADFLDWCAEIGVSSVTSIQPLHVATWIEAQGSRLSAPTVKQRLAALRHLFDWLVIGQVITGNPAAAVRGPRHAVRTGKTPILAPEEARTLLDSIDVTTVVGLRDRALIGLMVYSFSRIGAALRMTVADIYVQNRRLWVRLDEKGGRAHTIPCHHTLEAYLEDYLNGANLRDQLRGPLFRSVARGSARLGDRPLRQSSAHAMIRRRAKAAGIATAVGNHTFRATGITAYLKNGGTLEKAAAMAGHASTRTTQLYDRRADQVNLDEIERIRL